MTKLLFNEQLGSKFEQPKGTRTAARFTTIFKLFRRIVSNNGLLFLKSSLFAFLVAIINFVGSLLIDNLIFNKNDITLISSKKIELFSNGFFGYGDKINVDLRRFIFIVICYLLLFKASFSTLHWYMTTYAHNKIEKDLKVELFEILIDSDYEKSSEISARMLTQFSSTIDSIAYNIWSVPNRLIYVTTSILLYIISRFKNQEEGRFEYFFIGTLLLLFSLLFGVVIYFLRKSNKLSIESKKRYEEDNRFIFERILNIEYIKSVSGEESEKNKIDDQLTNTFRKNGFSILWNTLFRSVPEYLLTPIIPFVFIFVISSNLFERKVDNLGSLCVYFSVARRIGNEITKICTSILDLEDLSSDLSTIMDSINFLAKSSDNKELANFTRGDIIFDKVTFAYPSRAQNNIIENFSFTFEKNKRYGIAGKNGIGKSTITKILLKIYKTYKGNVLIDQKDLSTINTAELHYNICRLNNRPSFFNMSIAENIFYPFAYNRDQDLAKLLHAAKEVQVLSFIKSLPAGFDTILREGGGDLSEGQKQQLEAMKIFIKDYQIYIFDEILSNVHPLTRKIILANIFANIKDRLIITIDHHYDIFTHMDYVYTFSSKKLTPMKNLKELLKNPIEE